MAERHERPHEGPTRQASTPRGRITTVMGTDETLHTVEEAGRQLGVGRSKAYQLAASGELATATDRAGRRRVRQADIDRLLAERGVAVRTTARPEPAADPNVTVDPLAAALACPPARVAHPWFTCLEAAELLGMSEPVVKGLVDRGELGRAPGSGWVRIRRVDLARWLDIEDLHAAWLLGERRAA